MADLRWGGGLAHSGERRSRGRAGARTLIVRFLGLHCLSVRKVRKAPPGGSAGTESTAWHRSRGQTRPKRTKVR